MRLLIIRHADPDYERDWLTETGLREAELLAGRLRGERIDSFYVSPKGRARATAEPTLRAFGREAEVLEWLREFDAPILRPDRAPGRWITWDWLPADRAEDRVLRQYDEWLDHPIMAEADVRREYEWVAEGLDGLLSRHGYVREGHLYRVEERNHKTLALFCHFGVECVMLGHLLGVSPIVLWHGMCAAPSSVTTVMTEERREGVASFRVTAFGDTSHLYAAGEKPSFSARFCECWTDDTRHD